jgi:hypothetical protein
MLAARSLVFRRMLYGDFAEANKVAGGRWLLWGGAQSDCQVHLHQYNPILDGDLPSPGPGYLKRFY